MPERPGSRVRKWGSEPRHSLPSRARAGNTEPPKRSHSPHGALDCRGHAPDVVMPVPSAPASYL